MSTRWKILNAQFDYGPLEDEDLDDN